MEINIFSYFTNRQEALLSECLLSLISPHFNSSRCSGMTKLHPVVSLQFWRPWVSGVFPSLPLLLDPLCLKIVEPVRISSMGQVDLFEMVRMILNHIKILAISVYLFKTIVNYI